jgi:hypothetical protein
MNKVTLTATDTFYSTKHGLVVAGQVIEADEVEAQELLRMTSVQEGGKMEATPRNKMDPAPQNKTDPTDQLISADAPKVRKKKAVEDAKAAPTSERVPSPENPGTADDPDKLAQTDKVDLA